MRLHKKPFSHSLAPNLRIIRLALIWSMLGIGSRLFYLQIIHNQVFTRQSQRNYVRQEITASPRGNITDRYGKLLATNRPVPCLYWYGTGRKKMSPEQKQHLELLASILDKPLTIDTETYTHIISAERTYKKIPLAHDLSFKQLGMIKERFAHDANIGIDTEFKRLYPYHSYASHLVGYLGQVDVGKMGLERIFDPLLKGVPGTIIKQINSFGKQLGMQELKKKYAGNDIRITLDIDLQHVAESIFPSEYTGTILVMDPYDGDILALASRPSFNPSLFLDPISPQSWNSLQENQPFLNRAFQASYPPGSIFKLVSAAAALEEGLIEQESTWDCDGFIYFGKRKYWCHKRDGHGVLTTSQALAQSCNILFYEIGKQLPIDTLAHYARLFGLGQKTGLRFTEKTGLIPSTEWKKNTFGERWWPGETVSAAIGQSYILTTPLQIGCLISSIMTGYRTRPRVLLNEDIEHYPLGISAETLDFLRQSMRAVVTHGTGKRLDAIPDFHVYAKTSTAQTSALKKRRMAKQYKEHGWFVAHLSYKQQRPMTLVILIENVGSARHATVTARNFLIAYKKMFEAKKKSVRQNDCSCMSYAEKDME